ncbi:MAG: NAD-dependent epimerase/dehydratase family protein, partial [Bdellovibrionaceae bacterium]|nr:NAD-dependent epimerase/dehydratase family protein [Pseudobdellovibrionaceae bacterium]
MKIIIAGGTGHLGSYIVSHWKKAGHSVIVLSRSGQNTANVILWDGVNDGPWMTEIDGADVVLNLAGRTVNCRYTPENLKQMMDSRVLSTKAIGRALQKAKKPPHVWLQMS